jgi:two-component system, OmpR family, alkaline phosphatase synthesis response regulator PhoP
MKTILVVDDEQDIVEFVRYNLQKEGFRVLTARNGRQALEQVGHHPDCILLDIMMPELDGKDVLRELRGNAKTSGIPVVFLTARGSDVDEVVGLELGADDYIVKPISVPKLIARIKNVLRKYDVRPAEPSSSRPILLGPIEIIPKEHVVRIDGAEVFFPKKEFEVLSSLASRLGEVVNRETLLNEIWGTDVRVIDRTVDVHIRKIREKMGKYADAIETIKGIGYRMRSPV